MQPLEESEGSHNSEDCQSFTDKAAVSCLHDSNGYSSSCHNHFNISINNEACVLIQALCHKASDYVKRKPPSFLGIYEQFQFHFDFDTSL